MVELLALPPEVARVVPGYLGLFRPAKNTLSWVRVRRIAGEVRALTTVGEVSKTEGNRPCPPALWAKAMEQVLAQRETVKRPLANHNYLISIAWAMADETAARTESRRERLPASASGRAEMDMQRDPRMAKARVLAAELRQSGEPTPIWEIIPKLLAGDEVMGHKLEKEAGSGTEGHH